VARSSHSARAAGSTALDENAAHSYARAQIARIFDSTPADATRTLASALVSGTTPGHSRWVAYGVDGVDQDDLDDDAKVWLDEAAEVIWKNIHNSNFDAVHFECEIDTASPGSFTSSSMKTRRAATRSSSGRSRSLGGGVEAWRAARHVPPRGAADGRAVRLEYGEEMVSQGVRQKASSRPTSS
jgi:hypothetical protein